MSMETLNAFESIGAEARIETQGTSFVLDVVEEAREYFKLTAPVNDELRFDVLDSKPHLRHLVLEVSGWRLPIFGRYLCGHDERHWFAAPLPNDRRAHTVRGAMESLKPELVRREQKRKGVKTRKHRRKTAAYVRQGEWFFLPRPMMHVGDKAQRNGRLVRGQGKPHRVSWIYQPVGSNETYVRGAVSHPDHETLLLQVWHRVVQNNEPEQAVVTTPFMRMDYFD